jgi:hypothetical protein
MKKGMTSVPEGMSWSGMGMGLGLGTAVTVGGSSVVVLAGQVVSV